MFYEPLVHPEPAGVIWTALVLDYPDHSFSHLGLFFGMCHRTCGRLKGSKRSLYGRGNQRSPSESRSLQLSFYHLPEHGRPLGVVRLQER